MSHLPQTPRDGNDPAGSVVARVANVLPDNGRNPVSVWVKDALGRIDDPVGGLPPTAQRVLAGAMRVVVSKGFGKLTLARISEESGENVAAVKYYFGNKAGLVSVLIDAVVYAQLVQLTRRSGTGLAASGLSRLGQETLTLSTLGEPLRVLFELLPHALRDKKLREQLRGYYETFYSLHLAQLDAGEGADPDLRARMNGLAMLLAAVADGLTMQALVAPRHFDVGEALRAFDVLITSGMPALLRDGFDRSQNPSQG
jgi:AcrR family transcriptional regulator